MSSRKPRKFANMPKASTALPEPVQPKARKRRKGQARIGTKPAKIKAAHERRFQEELGRIRAIGASALPSAKKIPPPVLIRPKKKKSRKNLISRVKERLRGNQDA